MKWTRGPFKQEGKAKSLYEVTGHPSLVWMEFKDDLTAFNGKKKSYFNGKGQINRDFSSLAFRFLEKEGIKSHWHLDVGGQGMICKSLTITPLEVVVRNRLTGRTARKFQITEGTLPSQPLVEFYYKKDSLGDPFISKDQALAFGFISQQRDIDFLKEQALRINQKMQVFFDSVGLELIDFKVEFGKLNLCDLERGKGANAIEPFILADEFSCDTCRLWDKKTGKKQDKDLFRLDLGGVETAYRKTLQALSKEWGSRL